MLGIHVCASVKCWGRRKSGRRLVGGILTAGVMVCGNCMAWEHNCRNVGFEMSYKEVLEKNEKINILLTVKLFGI